MSEVWRAVDTRLDREVAVKFLAPEISDDPGWLARFETEAKVVASLDHPNIVTIHSIEETDGRRFLTMELIRGSSLRELIPPEGFSSAKVLECAVPMCEAVCASHASGITHGDLKPSNVMVTEDGTVKILDFGLAFLRETEDVAPPDEDTTEPELPAPGVAGTVPYMAPEQLDGNPPDPWSDIFSLGAVLYEMATGRRPFRGSTRAEMIASILRDEPIPPSELNPELPRRLDRAILSCLEKDRRHRTQTSTDLREELVAIRRELGSLEKGDIPSIAVLPFLDLSIEKDQDYFCEGIAEEIINALTQIHNLRVVSRTSSFALKGRGMDSREIAERLGVGTLLEGSVRKSGEQLRVTAQLIGASSGYHLWSDRFDRELKDVFAIQDEIAQAIADALRVKLSPGERRAIKQVATDDARAYDHYLRGRKYYYQYGRKGIEYARQMFSRAIEIDPSYALAHAGYADCCSYLYSNTDAGEEVRNRAIEASARALELDPHLAEAHAARGVALSLEEDFERADEAFETATRLNPRLFEAHYFRARHCFQRGESERAIAHYERAAEVRPEDYQSLLLVAQTYDDLGRTDEARDARRRGVKRAEDRLDLNPDDTRALYMGANGLVALGETELGLEWARRALEAEPDEPMILYNVACIYSLAGQLARAVVCLERAVDQGFAHRVWLEKDSNLDALRDLPEYHKILRRL
jgi:serine/threonine protein kinase/tetratricopeptide (TPR) repeat protein